MQPAGRGVPRCPAEGRELVWKSPEGCVPRLLRVKALALPCSLGQSEQPLVDVMSYEQEPAITLLWLIPYDAGVKAFLHLPSFRPM